MEKLERPQLWRRALDFAFGYDFFISYASRDGSAYAQLLSHRLEEMGFEVFLDRDDYASGDDWKKVGSWTLRRTGQLILIGSPGALASAPVAREVELFSRTGRRIVPIDFGGSLDGVAGEVPLGQYLPPDILRIREPSDGLATGPSDATIGSIVRTFTLVRQDKKRVLILAVVAVLLALLAVAALIFALHDVDDFARNGFFEAVVLATL
jgi:hypothetical protein